MSDRAPMGLRPFSLPYSPKLVEEAFSEVHRCPSSAAAFCPLSWNA
jgi:hypothetical protein